MNPSARLKVNRDTYFFPDTSESVYFRNNVHSFRMEGGSIEQWIEKLIPVWNGSHSLAELTEGLPEPYRRQIYEIAEVLSRNGFVRDVSQDRPHQLPESVMSKYASQIEFIDSFGGSGANRFEGYRQMKVLAVGSGPFLLSLAAALLESGLPKFHLMSTDAVWGGRGRLMELVEHARKTDPEAEVTEVPPNRLDIQSTRERLRGFDAVLYVSERDNLEEMQGYHAACRAEKVIFIPALRVHQTGMAGPLVEPDDQGCWESAWRRVHRPTLCHDPEAHTFSSTARALLANVIVFEWFKKATGVTEEEPYNRFYLLNLETMEGEWHSFLPHPLVSGSPAAVRIHDVESRTRRKSDRSASQELLSFFGGLTSTGSGIFHSWEEGDLRQLPLSQCRVQAVDPLTTGPAELLPDIICTELTHEKARRESGLAGLEAYASRLAGTLLAEASPKRKAGNPVDPDVLVGVGAGETAEEAIGRGLQKCLTSELAQKLKKHPPEVRNVQLAGVDDENCRYYLQSIAIMQGKPPELALGEPISGFPVVWVHAGGSWKGSAGLNTTIALRNALAQTIQWLQNQSSDLAIQSGNVPVIVKPQAPLSLAIPAADDSVRTDELLSALTTLKQNGRQLKVYELNLEPELRRHLEGVFAVVLKGDSR